MFKPGTEELMNTMTYRVFMELNMRCQNDPNLDATRIISIFVQERQAIYDSVSGYYIFPDRVQISFRMTPIGLAASFGPLIPPMEARH